MSFDYVIALILHFALTKKNLITLAGLLRFKIRAIYC